MPVATKWLIRQYEASVVHLNELAEDEASWSMEIKLLVRATLDAKQSIALELERRKVPVPKCVEKY